MYEDLKILTEIAEEAVVESMPKKVICPECKEGEINTVFSFEDRDIISCTDCDFRKAIKK